MPSIKHCPFGMKRPITILRSLRSWFSTDIIPSENSAVASQFVDHREWFKQRGFNDEEYAILLGKYPRLKEVQLDQPITAKLSFLSEKGMNQQGIIRFFDNVLKQYPEFLEFSLEDDIEPNFSHLSSLGLSNEEVLIMVIKFPQILSYDIKSNYSRKIQYLMELGFTHAEVLKIIFHFPQLVEVSLENNMDPLVTYLIQELDFEPPEVQKIIGKSPEILGVRLGAIRAKLEYLIETGFDLRVVKALIKRFPVFLRGSLERDLQPILELLLDYSSLQTVHRIFIKCPQLLCKSYEMEVHPKILFLVELGYDPVDLRVMLEKFPEILCYSLEHEIMPAVQKSIEIGLTMMQTRITFARNPELFRQTIQKVRRDADRLQL